MANKAAYFNSVRKPKRSYEIPGGEWQKVCFFRKRSQRPNNLEHYDCDAQQHPGGPDRRTRAYRNQHNHQEPEQEHDQGNDDGYVEINQLAQPQPHVLQPHVQNVRTNNSVRTKTRSGIVRGTRESKRLRGFGFVDEELGHYLLNGYTK